MNAPDTSTVRVGDRDLTMADAEAIVRNRASWFYWIAGLSLLNWLAMMMNLAYSMIVGLGITQVVSAVTADATRGDGAVRITAWIATFVATACASAVFIFLGYHARRIVLWPFVVGLVLYGLDSLIFAAARDWIGLGFHAFVMMALWSGIVMTRAIVHARVPVVTIGSLTKGDGQDA